MERYIARDFATRAARPTRVSWRRVAVEMQWPSKNKQVSTSGDATFMSLCSYDYRKG